MGIRTGAEYFKAMSSLEADIWLDGRRIENVAQEPALHCLIWNIARLYDMQHDPRYQDVITHVCPETGRGHLMRLILLNHMRTWLPTVGYLRPGRSDIRPHGPKP